MSTIRQQKLAKSLIDNLAAKHSKTKQELVLEAGYSEKTADRASKDIIESVGVKDSLVSFGFDENRAKEVVAEILEAGENDTVKLKAADMIFKVHGTYAPEKNINVNVEAEVSPQMLEMAKQLDELRRNPKGSA